MIPFLSDHIDSVDLDMTSLDGFLGGFFGAQNFCFDLLPA